MDDSTHEMSGPNAYPTLKITDPDERRRIAEQFRRAPFSFCVRDVPDGLQLAPSWVEAGAPPDLFRIVASCPIDADVDAFMKSLTSAIDDQFEQRVDAYHQRLREAMAEESFPRSDTPATRFAKSAALLRATRASDLRKVLNEVVQTLRQSHRTVAHLLGVQINIGQIVATESAYRSLMSVERWGLHATRQAVDADVGAAAVGITNPLLALIPYLLAYPLVHAPVMHGTLFARDSVAVIAIFRSPLGYPDLQGGQECVDRLLNATGGPLWDRGGDMPVPDVSPADGDDYYRWYLQRLNVLYSALWDPRPLVVSMYPFSQLVRTYSTVNSIAYDIGRLRGIRDRYIAKRLAFGAIDKLANVAASSPNREPGVAKRLLHLDTFERQVDPALAMVPTSWGRLVESLGDSHANRAAQEEIWESIRYPTMFDPTRSTIVISTKTGPQVLTPKEFAVEYWRQVRNLAHGFSLKNDRFENVLALTVGMGPRQLLGMVDGLWHTVLVDPSDFLVNGWGLS